MRNLYLIIAFLIFIVNSFIVTGCKSDNKNNVQEVLKIQFNTSNLPGVCYYTYKNPISTKSGQLTFQNRNNFSIHITISNAKQKGLIEYEADLDAGGILSYYNINSENEYYVNIRVMDGKGIDNVTVMIYDDYRLIEPYVLNN